MREDWIKWTIKLQATESKEKPAAHPEPSAPEPLTEEQLDRETAIVEVH